MATHLYLKHVGIERHLKPLRDLRCLDAAKAFLDIPLAETEKNRVHRDMIAIMNERKIPREFIIRDVSDFDRLKGVLKTPPSSSKRKEPPKLCLNWNRSKELCSLDHECIECKKVPCACKDKTEPVQPVPIVFDEAILHKVPFGFPTPPPVVNKDVEPPSPVHTDPEMPGLFTSPPSTPRDAQSVVSSEDWPQPSDWPNPDPRIARLERMATEAYRTMRREGHLSEPSVPAAASPAMPAPAKRGRGRPPNVAKASPPPKRQAATRDKKKKQ